MHAPQRTGYLGHRGLGRHARSPANRLFRPQGVRSPCTLPSKQLFSEIPHSSGKCFVQRKSLEHLCQCRSQLQVNINPPTHVVLYQQKTKNKHKKQQIQKASVCHKCPRGNFFTSTSGEIFSVIHILLPFFDMRPKIEGIPVYLSGFGGI